MTAPADIAATRHRLALTQAELGALLGVHAYTVCRWESGELAPSPWHLQLLAVFDTAARKSPRAGRQAVNASRGGVPQALFWLLCQGLAYVPCPACASRGCPSCDGHGFTSRAQSSPADAPPQENRVRPGAAPATAPQPTAPQPTAPQPTAPQPTAGRVVALPDPELVRVALMGRAASKTSAVNSSDKRQNTMPRKGLR